MTYGTPHRADLADLDGATENGATALLALAAAEPVDLVEGGGVKHLVLPQGAKPLVLDLQEYGEAPRRTQGTARFVDPESFAAYFERHGDADTFLYANQDASTVTAVFNDDQTGKPGWRDHRAVLQLKVSPEWLHWEKYNNQFVHQGVFAEHIQGGLPQVAAPPAADLLELVEDFEVVSKATFRSGEKISTGERRLTFIEENKASGAGKQRTVDLPGQITLRVAPWIGAAAFEITARFAYKARPEEGLKFRYTLVEPHVHLEEAFRQVTGQVGELTGAKVLQGTPIG